MNDKIKKLLIEQNLKASQVTYIENGVEMCFNFKQRDAIKNAPLVDYILKTETPIELPSDGEIKVEARSHYMKGQLLIEPASDTEYAFQKGAKWMKKQIKGGNK